MKTKSLSNQKRFITFVTIKIIFSCTEFLWKQSPCINATDLLHSSQIKYSLMYYSLMKTKPLSHQKRLITFVTIKLFSHVLNFYSPVHRCLPDILVITRFPTFWFTRFSGNYQIGRKLKYEFLSSYGTDYLQKNMFSFVLNCRIFVLIAIKLLLKLPE